MASETVAASRLGLSRAAVEELARSRREPDWLVQLRVRAFEAYTGMPMPDQRTEGWRRTSLRGLDLERPDVFGAVSVAVEGVADGVVVLDLAEAARDQRVEQRVRDTLGHVVSPEVDKFTALHYAFWNAGVLVYVPRNVVVEQPIWIRYLAEQAALVHTLVIAEESSGLTLVEEFAGGAALASGAVEQVVGPNASLRYVHLQRWSPDVWNFSAQRARLAQDAHLRTLNVALGARMARNTVQVTLEGRGSQADLLGVVGIDERQHVDFETLQDHHADATRSDLVIHDALRGRSSANFTGLIRINKTARQTESSQEQKNILLSDRAKADSDPKLEILNNDVIRCTHGAAVGPVDPEMVFYLQSRGLDSRTAERLIVEGFFQAVLRKLEAPALEEAVWSAIAGSATEA